jgi:hypothetical protein
VAPRNVKIGPFKYALRWSVRVPEQEHGPLYGYCDNDEQIIYCRRTGVHHDQIADTLMHEILHAALHVGRTNLTENQEEKVVAALAPLLLDILRRNPQVLAYLQEQQ